MHKVNISAVNIIKKLLPVLWNLLAQPHKIIVCVHNVIKYLVNYTYYVKKKKKLQNRKHESPHFKMHILLWWK